MTTYSDGILSEEKDVNQILPVQCKVHRYSWASEENPQCKEKISAIQKFKSQSPSLHCCNTVILTAVDTLASIFHFSFLLTAVLHRKNPKPNGAKNKTVQLCIM